MTGAALNNSFRKQRLLHNKHMIFFERAEYLIVNTSAVIFCLDFEINKSIYRTNAINDSDKYILHPTRINPWTAWRTLSGSTAVR